jgi:hypothetical protein
MAPEPLLVANRTGYFTHIHKCGGTSQQSVCHKYVNLFCVGNAKDPAFVIDSRTHNKIPLTEVAAGFQWTFVRNPWARLSSLYRMIKLQPRFRYLQPESLTFERLLRIVANVDWATWSPPGWSELPRGWFKKMENTIRWHAIPCTHPTFRLDSQDFIGRVERISEDWPKVADILGVPASLPRLNRGGGGDNWQKCYDRALFKDLVTAVYRDDIRRFKFKFQ